MLSMVLFELGLNLSHRADATPLLVANESAAKPSQTSFTCPNQLPELTALLLRDLPAYSNRIIQRTQDLNQAAGNENYIITASKAEFEPLDLPRLSYDQSKHVGDRVARSEASPLGYPKGNRQYQPPKPRVYWVFYCGFLLWFLFCCCVEGFNE